MQRQPRRKSDGARVLVVEDNDDFRLLMTLTLEDAGYVVDAVAAAEDGLARLDAERYDLALTDYSLPGHSGAWLLSEATSRGIPTLIVTGDPDAPGIATGAAVVRKPIDFDRLLSQLRSMLTRGAEQAA